MPAYTEGTKAACRGALAEIARILRASGIDYRVIGGSAILAILESSPRPEAAAMYVGTQDVDIAAADSATRDALKRLLLDAGARPDPDDLDRVWLTVTVRREVVEAPIDVLTSSLLTTVPGRSAVSSDLPVLATPALLLAKMRPYQNKQEKGKDGYDVYMLLAYAELSPEAIAEQCARELPPDLTAELLTLVEVFFLAKRRATRDAAAMLRDYHGITKSSAVRDVINVAERFARTLQSLLEA
ncbi:MAG: hypothetical protein U9R79_01380 [Armatimonadota bacterium]|nr:hypothetical protein [Armatimonadota bacterium]